MNNHKLANRNAWYVFISLVLSLSVYLTVNSVVAQSVNTLNSTTTDAIAVRIVANPAQYSIDDWYAKQRFTGSPSKIKVDGYDAIRDNRTVYVAATNIKGTCLEGDPCSIPDDCSDGAGVCNLSKLYFNIYIITYNQGATTQTSDVFGKILANWKFNNNLSSNLGTCSFPPKNCSATSDCGNPDDYEVCDPSTSSKCISKQKCLIDADCQNGSLCNSSKASLVRDVQRLQSLNKINQSLKDYKNLHGKYPILTAGTFLPQAVISTWPSWQNVFASQIGSSVLADPVNKLGICNTASNATTTMTGFDNTTCWNGNTKKYYNGSNSVNLELPADSYALAYSANLGGSSYNLCANMETNYTFMSSTSSPVNLANLNCHTTASSGYGGTANNDPKIVAVNLNGVIGKEFNGYIKAEDPDGDPVSFVLIDDNIDWTGFGWSAKPIFLPTSDPNQKKLWAQKAGDDKPYNITVKVMDGRSGASSTSTVINISAGEPTITASDAEYDLSSDPNNILDYNLYFDDPAFDYLNLYFSSSLASTIKGWFNNLSSLFVNPTLAAPINPSCATIPFSGGSWKILKTQVGCFKLNNGLNGVLSAEASGRYKLNITGTVDTSAFNQDANLNYKIKVHNLFGKTTEKAFTIKLKSNPPRIDFSCNKKAGLYQNYSCQINNLNPKNNNTTYLYGYRTPGSSLGSVGLPSGFVGNAQTGLISGTPTNIGSYIFMIEAKNEYGVSTKKEYGLTVESSCGKELVKYSGGPWNQTGEIKNQGGYYKTVLIDNQCWMADNLNVPVSAVLDYSGGGSAKAIPATSWWKNILSLLFRPYNALAQTTIQALNQVTIGTCYNSNNAYCEAEGRLYRASEATAGATSESVRGICPPGYHIPSKAEFSSLAAVVGASAGDKLKIDGDSGFEGYLSGTASKAVNTTTFAFANRNTLGNFWSSTLENAGTWYRRLSSGSSFEEDQGADTTQYYSLRCVQDKLCPSSCDTCSTMGACCDSASWSPALNTKCGSFIQTDNCGLTRVATGTIACVSPNTCGANGNANICGCTPSCVGKVCGPNGCGGSCGTCSGNDICALNGSFCQASINLCTPDCNNKVCGPDGCGGSCGTCPGSSVCSNNGNLCQVNGHGNNN
ncbi:MAG: FISUMP domain-containing protein [Patescibacteria group bacterium]